VIDLYCVVPWRLLLPAAGSCDFGARPQLRYGAINLSAPDSRDPARQRETGAAQGERAGDIGKS